MSHPHQPTSPFGQPPSPFGPHPYPPQPPKKHTALKVAASVVGALLVFGVGVAAGSGSENTGTKVKAEPAPAVTVTVTAGAATPKTEKAASGKPKTKAEPAEQKKAGQPKKAAPEATISQGSYLVGEDVDAGTYRTGGPSDSDIPLCYWARNKDSSGELDSIIANGTPQGPARVTINKGEIFETNGCEEWKRVS
ncbi:hypothetical protein [Streptomyces sp. NPDC048248]|uniref:hypothetical protein n=1 Tax=Streptomyces sp. NPDC048248 TaxID=3365523 RepID=UPI003724B167